MIMHTYLLQLCELVSPVVEYKQVKEFFVDQWAPSVAQLYTAGGVLAMFLLDLCRALQSLETHEVKHSEKPLRNKPCAYVW